ncbi:MAG TPA: SpoIID/LytB domain-containing protein [Bacteroidia bacterium]|jgi:stage II sporulation protein D|nr:SpoIID/LytB domain-containing protein [Bacteroidia bacterium]
MKQFILFLFCFINAFAFSQDVVYIKVFAHLKINAATFSVQKSTYNIIADDKILLKDNGTTILKLTAVNDSVEVKSFETVYGRFKNVKMISQSMTGEVKLKLVNPDRKQRVYPDNYNVSNELGNLKIINEVKLDNYIAGVVEAESGTSSTPEFYKVQAILARTFALAHINKHLPEGFSLCDQVHCQAYYGKPRFEGITEMVLDTKGKVVVDENLNLIVAAFHSNSGGQTANSEDVWGTRTSYLKSVNDTFSAGMPNYKWERKMLTEDWLSYLKLKHNYPVDEAGAKALALNFKQDTRKIYLEASNIKVPLKNVRQDLQLKSTYFNISKDGDSVIFEGKGYGHSLGMSQEGAMRMTKLGYSYTDVLNFYYRNIQIIDMRKLAFFRDE